MSNRTFFQLLLLVSAVTALLLWGMYQSPKLAAHTLLGWGSLGMFILLSILMFFMAGQSARSSNKNQFTNTVLGFTAGKMMLVLMVLFMYLQLAEPTDKLFVLPFLAVYFIFTAFETWFMMKIGRTSV
ncbi:MAG: hypothetical protein R2795_02615 [Saprospiraceae bacterium]